MEKWPKLFIVIMHTGRPIFSSIQLVLRPFHYEAIVNSMV